MQEALRLEETDLGRKAGRKSVQSTSRTTSQPVSQSTSPGRLFFVDNIRVFLTILVIGVHTAIAYGGAGSWAYSEHVSDTAANVLLTLFNAVNQSFFMGLFFLLAGYFTPEAYDRKGAGKFLKDRIIRLGIPLVIYITLINPVISYYFAKEEGLKLSFIEFWSEGFLRFNQGYISNGPLWFVQTLLIFCVAYAVIRRFTKAPVASGQTGTGAPSNGAIVALALLLGMISFVARLIYPVGRELFGMQLGFYPQYVALFALGIIAYRRGWLTSIPEAAGKLWGSIATFGILMLPVLMIAGGALNEGTDIFIGGLHWQAFAYAMLEQLMGIALCVVVLIQFRKRLNSQGRFEKFLSANAYTVYIIHAPILIAIQLSLRNVYIYPLLKFGLVLATAVTVCFLTSNYVVRKLPYSARVL